MKTVMNSKMTPLMPTNGKDVRTAEQSCCTVFDITVYFVFWYLIRIIASCGFYRIVDKYAVGRLCWNLQPELILM